MSTIRPDVPLRNELTVRSLAQGAASGRQGVRAVVGGALASAGYFLIVNTQIFAVDVARYVRFGRGADRRGSPVSGVGILAVLIAALLMVGIVRPLVGASLGPALVAFALFATTFVFSAAIIGNDNLQDLKTGQLAGATPLALVRDRFLAASEWLGVSAFAALIAFLHAALDRLARGKTRHG